MGKYMQTYLFVIVIALIFSGVLLRVILRLYNRIGNSQILLSQKNEIIRNLQTLEAKWHARTIEIEDAVRKEYGIKARIEKTEVNCVFNKLELAIMQAGMSMLMGRPNIDVNDAEYYIALIRKIDEVLPDMEEPRVAPEPSSSRPKS